MLCKGKWQPVVSSFNSRHGCWSRLIAGELIHEGQQGKVFRIGQEKPA
jgi:hypothetical protein